MEWKKGSAERLRGALLAPVTIKMYNHWQVLQFLYSFNKYLLSRSKRTTILQPVEQKPHSQKDRQDEKAEGYVPGEGTT